MSTRINERSLHVLSKRIAADRKEVTLAQRSASSRVETLGIAYRREAQGALAAKRAITSRSKLTNVPAEEMRRDLQVMRRLLSEQERTVRASKLVLNKSKNELTTLTNLRRAHEGQEARVAQMLDNRAVLRCELDESSESDELSILSALKERSDFVESFPTNDTAANSPRADWLPSPESGNGSYDGMSRSYEGNNSEQKSDALPEQRHAHHSDSQAETDGEQAPHLSLRYQTNDGEEAAISIALEEDGTVSLDFNSSRVSSPWITAKREQRFREALEREGIGVDHVSIVSQSASMKKGKV